MPPNETLDQLRPRRGHNTLHRQKITSARSAVQLIRSGDTVGTSGFVGIGFAEMIARELEQRFLNTGTPSDLTLVYAAGQGDGREQGLNHLGHEGLIKRVIGGHWGLVPSLQKLALANLIEGYNLPQGVISHLYRDIAAGKPGTISSVGLGTFVDPRQEGGKINSATTEDMVELITLNGENYLFFKAFPINVAIIRGTTADTQGNISMEKEALTLESLPLAMAAKNSGGIVIAQVERIAAHHSINARQIHIPGILVDCVVKAEPEHHKQTFGTQYNPSFSGEVRGPMDAIPTMELNQRKIIARRAAFELKPNSVVNLGIGIPEGVSSVANEEQILDYLTLTAEPGIIGGVPAGGLDFGAAFNADAIIDQPYQFDYYDGGGLDITFLGMAQADSSGNVNVSRFSNRLAGAGGFINISQNTPKVVFVGTFSSGKPAIEVIDDELRITDDPNGQCKFVADVEQITFCGSLAAKRGRTVLYVTERCVFQLTTDGLELIEIAPGVDLEQDILSHMSFRPKVSEQLKKMDSRIFRDFPMGLDEDLLNIPMSQRVSYFPERREIFLNFENYVIRNKSDIEAVYNVINECCDKLEKPLFAVANYDNFILMPEMTDDFFDMIRFLKRRYVKKITAYTTSAFLRMQLDSSLTEQNGNEDVPQIYDSLEQAEQALID